MAISLILNMNNYQPTLFCLPFAGGNLYSYRSLATHLNKGITLVTLELPGRGRKMQAPLLTKMEAAVDLLFSELVAALKGQKYAIYGHSMGGLLAYLLVAKLIKNKILLPIHLFISGRAAPSNKDKVIKHQLPQDEFFAYLKRLGGLPDEIFQNKELLALFEPILRADFEIIDSYQHQQKQKQTLFDLPMTLINGEQDKSLQHDQLPLWQRECARPIHFKTYSGGHFFIFDHCQSLAELFSNELLNH